MDIIKNYELTEHDVEYAEICLLIFKRIFFQHRINLNIIIAETKNMIYLKWVESCLIKYEYSIIAYFCII